MGGTEGKTQSSPPQGGRSVPIGKILLGTTIRRILGSTWVTGEEKGKLSQDRHQRKERCLYVRLTSEKIELL